MYVSYRVGAKDELKSSRFRRFHWGHSDAVGLHNVCGGMFSSIIQGQF